MKRFLLIASVLFLVACVSVDTSDHESSMDPSMHDTSMTMDDMVMMLDGKTGDAFDRAFIDAMIPHHQGAIDMAERALEDAGHQEIKDMAQDIIEAQQAEIDRMRRWQTEWGYTE